ncbi:MAG: restriction endonuclease subunit S, partial [Chloroflexi bacterium]|nr:restriction endonuclease subunit S [Chloroflexota bacterium]
TRTHGTIFDTITRETFKIAEAVLAPTGVAQAFESVITPVMDRISGNLNESRSLADQRDTLLPKLVSGETTVRGRDRWR